MEGFFNAISGIDSGTLTMYINFFFIGLGAFALLGFIFGLIRGTYRALSFFLCLGISFTVTIFVSVPLSKTFYSMDSKWIMDLIHLERPAEIVSFGAYFENLANTSLAEAGVDVTSNAQALEAIQAIANSCVSILVYLVLIILDILIIAPILHLIIYNTIFKLIFSRKRRKKKKMRPLGGLISMIEGVVTFSLLLSPATGLVNAMANGAKSEDGTIQKKESDNAAYNGVMNLLTCYNDSAVSKYFVTLSFGQNKSFDVALMDYVSTGSYGTGDKQTTFSAYSEIGNLSGLIIKALETGAFKDSVDVSLLLTPAFVNEALKYVGESPLVSTLLSIGVTLATNSDKVKEFADLSSVDFFSIDWSNTTTSLATAYNELYEAGLIDAVLAKEGEAGINDLYIDYSTVDHYKKAVKAIGNDSVISTVFPKILASYAKSFNANNKKDDTTVKARNNDDGETPKEEDKDSILSSITLPEEESFYSTITWGSELSTLINVFAGISQQYYGYYGNRLSIGKLGEAFSTDPMKFIFGLDSVTSYTSLQEKYDNNVFINGGNRTVSVEGKDTSIQVPGIKAILGTYTGENVKDGLFDLSIIKKIAEETNDLIDFIKDVNLSDFVGDIEGLDKDAINNLSESFVTELKTWKLNDWKNEFADLCESILPLMDLADTISNSTNGIFSCGENIEYTFAKFDDSRLIKAIIPNTLNALVGDKISFGEGENKISPDFTNIENWALEGHCLRELMDSIKEVASTDISSIDWLNLDNITEAEYNAAVSTGYTGTFDDYYIDNSKLYKMINSLYKTQSIGGKYTESGREGGMFTSVLEDVVMSALSSFSKNLDINTLPEKDIIKLDFKLNNGTALYSGTNNYVSWEKTDAYNGEIANIILLVSELSSLSSGGGSTDNIETAVKLLNRANNCYVLRNVITPLLKELAGGNEFVEKADFDAFHDATLSATPYKYVTVEGKDTVQSITATITTRSEEIALRKVEIDSISSIIDSLTEVTDALSETAPAGDSFYPIKKLTANKELTLSLDASNPLKTNKDKSLLEGLATSLANSRIFNTPKYNESHHRVGTTAFEYFFQYMTSRDDIDVSKFITNFSEDPSLLYEISEANGWTQEIESFNAALYGVLNNDLVSLLTESTDLLNDVNALITSGKTPIQDLFATMQESELLKGSIVKVLDGQFLPLIIDNLSYDKDVYYADASTYEKVSNFYLNNNASKVKQALTLYKASAANITLADTDVTRAFWKNEGAVLEEAISGISKIDFSSLDIADDSIDIASITNAIRHSLCLNYLNEEDVTDGVNNVSITVTSDKKVRSVYQLLTIKTVDIAKDALHSALVSGSEKDYTTADDIKSFDKEIDVIVDIISSYKDVKNLLNVTDADALNASQVDKLENFMDIIFRSDVYNYLYQGTSHKAADDTTNEHSYYERLVLKLDSFLKDALISVFDPSHTKTDYTNVEDLVYSTKVIDSTNVESTRRLNAYQYEASLIIRSIKSYLTVSDLLKGDIVTDLTEEGKTNIKTLFNVLKESVVFNYPIGQLSVYSVNNYYKTPETTFGKHSDNSLYENVTIFMVDKMNSVLSSSLSIDVSEAGAKRIKDYSKEIDTIFDVITAYQGTSSYLSGGSISLSSGASTVTTAIKGLLTALEKSDVYHYVRNDSWLTRTDNKLTVFEQIISKLLCTASMVDSMYNANNPAHAGLTNGKDVVEMRIKEITANELKAEASQDPSLNWLKSNGEINRINSIIENYSTFEFDSTNNGLDTYISKSAGGEFSGVLADINASYLLHDLVSSMTREFVCKAKIDDASKTPTQVGYQGMLIKEASAIGYYSIDASEVPFMDKVTAWNNELIKLVSIIDKVEELTSTTNVLDLVSSKPYETVLPALAETALFSLVVTDITMSLFHDYATITIGALTCKMSDFIVGSGTKVQLVEVAEGKYKTAYTTSINWKNEGQGFDKFLAGLSDFANAYATYAGMKSMSMQATYPIWTADVTPGVLAGEMIKPANLKNVFVEL